MKEQNRNTLKAALSHLPEYSPEDGVWSAIDRDLFQREEHRKLQKALAELPAHTPPDSLWDRIASALPDDREERPVLRVFRRNLARAAAAAVFLLTGYLVWDFYIHSPEEQVTFALVAEPMGEWEASFLSQEPIATDENLIEEAVTMFKESVAARLGDQYQIILAEWQELNDAKQALEEALEVYGQDPDLVRELKDIELARSEVVRKMARFI
jgi:hypothetical protein